jgi:hypothetical protein
MVRMLLAVTAAVALASAAPAYAGCPHCADCPEHKVASADEAEKKDGAKVACKCPGGDGKDCKCDGAKCECAHCRPKAEKKDDAKKAT